MRLEKRSHEQVQLTLDTDEARRLATAIIKHAEEMPSVALDLQSLLREADYETHHPFRGAELT